MDILAAGSQLAASGEEAATATKNCSECLWELEIGAGLEIERQEWGFPGHMGQTRTSKSLTCRQLYYQVLLKGDRKHECASCFCQKRESVASVSSCGQSCQFLISTIMESFL